MQTDGARTLAPSTLPAWPPGRLSHEELTRAVHAWVTSEPMRALAAASGWAWPAEEETGALLDRLVVLSDAWDFRGHATASASATARPTAIGRATGGEDVQPPSGTAPPRANPVERNAMPPAPANVTGRIVSESVIRDATTALGLVESVRPGEQRFSHLVVLAGTVRACLNRASYAAELLRNGLQADDVISLGAHRLLGTEPPKDRPAEPSEREQAAILGLGVGPEEGGLGGARGGNGGGTGSAGRGDVDSESAVVVAAARRAFGLSGPPLIEESAPDEGSATQRYARSARYRWPGVEVVIAPSEQPERGLRANTAAQLRYWRDLARLGPDDRVLLVTTQIYVPYQHLVGIEVLGLHTGCGVHTCGVDAAHSAVPTRDFTGRDYLQEVRSALLAARSLLAAARTGAS